VEHASAGGRAFSCVGWAARVRGIFCFEEQVRAEAEESIDSLRGLDLDVAVLTGDHCSHAAELGRRLGLPVQAELLPEDKVAAIIRDTQALGPVAMVGDGINDAPALARAEVGIAMGCGADVSRDSASVCLLGNDLRRLAWAIALARRTVQIIRQNLFWAFAYNTLGIALACTGRLNPVLAALAMVLSSLLVVGNSLRLHTDISPLESPLVKEGDDHAAELAALAPGEPMR
jgi:P-type E1-E2 ATPase